MKSGALVFIAAFLALAASWGGFVLAPQVQLGRNTQTNTVSGLYPQARPGTAKQGAEVYRALGCAYCHSQQVVQEGVRREVVLTDAGTNLSATIEALQKFDTSLNAVAARDQLTQLPKTLLTNASANAADAAMKAFEPAGAKIESHIVAVGPDIDRAWGRRRSVARDYLFDQPVQLGSRRIGPDLANSGARMPDVNWHLRHLYAPQGEVRNSTMPPYRFLFETRKIKGARSPDALNLPAEFAPPSGYEVVPTEEARVLVAYLVSLQAGVPLFESPVTPPPAPAGTETNAPATTVTETNAPAPTAAAK